jgi:hypothetical protein
MPLMRPLVNRLFMPSDRAVAFLNVTQAPCHHPAPAWYVCNVADQFAGARKDLVTTQQSSTTQFSPPLPQLVCFSSSNIIRNYSFCPSFYFIFCLYILLPSSSVLLLLPLATSGTLKSYPSLNTLKSINQSFFYPYFLHNSVGEVDLGCIYRTERYRLRKQHYSLILSEFEALLCFAAYDVKLRVKGCLVMTSRSRFSSIFVLHDLYLISFIELYLHLVLDVRNLYLRTSLYMNGTQYNTILYSYYWLTCLSS